MFFGHTKRGGLAAQSVVNIGRARPVVRPAGVLFPLSLQFGFGLGFWPTLVALVLLAIPPISHERLRRRARRPTLRSSRPLEVWDGSGQVLMRVETPIALPLIIAGVRIAAVQVVATATLGGLFGFKRPGLVYLRRLRTTDDASCTRGQSCCRAGRSHRTRILVDGPARHTMAARSHRLDVVSSRCSPTKGSRQLKRSVRFAALGVVALLAIAACSSDKKTTAAPAHPRRTRDQAHDHHRAQDFGESAIPPRSTSKASRRRASRCRSRSSVASAISRSRRSTGARSTSRRSTRRPMLEFLNGKKGEASSDVAGTVSKLGTPTRHEGSGRVHDDDGCRHQRGS